MCISIPGQIIEIVDPVRHLATVDIGGRRRQVNLSLLAPDECAAGNWVVVHAGIAVGVLSEEDALAAISLLREIDQLHEEELS